MLTKAELQRYNRQTILPEFGIEAQEKLKKAKVLIIGAGGLGCPILQYLAAAGVGNLGLVDDDVVDISNLHRQILYSENDIGRKKVEVAVEKLNILNPHVELTPYALRLTTENAESIFAHYDIIVDGSDNFPTRYLVDAVCARLKKPLVFGSIFKFDGQLSVFHYQGASGYSHLFPEPPAEDEAPNCSDIGVLGVLPGIIGSYMAVEVIKVITAKGEVLAGKLKTVDIFNNTTLIYDIPKTEETTVQQEVAAAKPDEIIEIDDVTFDTWKMDLSNPIFLVDVRMEHEFEALNIGGINIPWYELQDRLYELPKDRKIVFYCQTGQKSKMAVFLHRSLSGINSYSLKGGLNH